MITISTCHLYPEPPENLRPLQHALQARGLPADFLPWQSPQPEGLILPLCAWDYSVEPVRFAAWIKQHAHQFLNPAELMLWNMQKHYLLDLASHGIDVIPTEISAPSSDAVQDILRKNRWQTAVLKPVIGQSGKNVQKIQQNDPLDISLYQSDVVVQPFIETVALNGETSLIFFNGEFSHSVRRQPAPNEWRANSAYGVQILPAESPAEMICQARKALDALPEMPRYARVDGTIIGNRFLLNELELIEPALYLHTAPEALNRFVSLIETAYKRVNFGKNLQI